MEKVKWLSIENERRKDVKDVVFVRNFEIFDSFNLATLFYASNAFVSVSINDEMLDDTIQDGDIIKYIRIDVTKLLKIGKNRISFKVTSIDSMFFSEYKINYELRIVKPGGLMEFITPSNNDYGYYSNSLTEIGVGYKVNDMDKEFFDPILTSDIKPMEFIENKPLKKYKGQVIEIGVDYMIYDFHELDYGYITSQYRGYEGETIKFEYFDDSRKLVAIDTVTLLSKEDTKYNPLFARRYFRYLKVTFSEETVTVYMFLLKKD